MLRFIEIPEHGCAVLPAGCAKGAVRGDSHGIDVAGVADVVSLDAAGGKLPDLCLQVSIKDLIGFFWS